MPPGERRHLGPRTLQDMRDLCRVTSCGEPIKFQFQEDETCTVLEQLDLWVPFESMLLDQSAYPLDRRRGYLAGGEQIANRLRLSPCSMAPPPKVSLAARGKVLPRIAPPLEMLRADRYPEFVGRGLGKQA